MIDGNVVDMTFLGSPFRNQHAIIRARLADVIERANEGSGYDLSVLFERLALALRSHLLMEDNVVYPAMIASRDTALRGRAERLREAGGDQAERFEALYATWGERKLIDGDIPTFVRDIQAFARELRERMDAEDAQLYAHLPAERPGRRATA
jgi:iron-sulfur cluster repair protein YtfE (RIC family)